MPDDPKTYTQEEVDALIEERNKGLEANRNEALTELRKLKTTLKKYEGIDPEKYGALTAAAEEAERKRAELAGDWKAREQQLLEKVGKELEGRDGTIKSLRSALEKELVDARATAAIAEAKGSAKVLLPHVKQHVRVVEEDGQFVVHVVDEKGNPRIGDTKGAPMTISQFVEELRQDPDFARNFEGSGSSGGGATRSNAGGGGRRVISPSELIVGNNAERVIAGELKVATE